MRYGGTVAALAAVAVLLAGGCTSDPDEAADSGGTEGGDGGGTTTGLTDDTLRIGFIGADFGPLAEAGLAPDLGDQPKSWRA